MGKLVAENRFTLEATPERVWDVLGRAIFSGLSGLEKLHIIDENNFEADLKAKAYGIPLTMKLRGEMTDISPPTTLAVKLAVELAITAIGFVRGRRMNIYTNEWRVVS